MHAELNQPHRGRSDVPRPADIVRPVIPSRVLAGALSKVAGKPIWRRQLSPHEAKRKGNHDVSDVLPVTLETCAERAGQGHALHRRTRSTPTKTGAENVGNSTSSAPANVEPQIVRLTPEKTSLLRRLLFAFGVALGRAGQDLLRNQAGVLADRRLDLGGHVGIGLEEGL